MAGSCLLVGVWGDGSLDHYSAVITGNFIPKYKLFNYLINRSEPMGWLLLLLCSFAMGSYLLEAMNMHS